MVPPHHHKPFAYESEQSPTIETVAYPLQYAGQRQQFRGQPPPRVQIGLCLPSVVLQWSWAPSVVGRPGLVAHLDVEEVLAPACLRLGQGQGFGSVAGGGALGEAVLRQAVGTATRLLVMGALLQSHLGGMAVLAVEAVAGY